MAHRGIQDEDYMGRCLQLAREAVVNDNHGVGSLVVKISNSNPPRIVGEASEGFPGSSLHVSDHAEVLAINRACDELQRRDLSDCILYTTVEPCWMCSYVIRQTFVGRVVYGTPDLVTGGSNTRHPLLTLDGQTAPSHWKPPPQLMGGVLADECSRMKSMGEQ